MPAGTPVASIPHAAAVVPSILTAPPGPQMGAVGIAHGLPSEHHRGSWVTKGLILGRRDHKAHQLHLRMEAESAALKGSGILKTQPLFHENHNAERFWGMQGWRGAHLHHCTHGATLQCHDRPRGWGPAGAMLSPSGVTHGMGTHTVHPHCPVGRGPTSHILVVQKHCKLPPSF